MQWKRYRMDQVGQALLCLTLFSCLTGISTCEEPDDTDGDGYTGAEGDCDDDNDHTHPDALELCDARDNDCDGSLDEGGFCYGTIATVVGIGIAGFSGDGGPAQDAQLNAPMGLASSPDGTLFIADNQNHRVRMVDPMGEISTFAGTGVRGVAGDGGPAVEAELAAPNGVALDGLGRLLVGDYSNARVRRINLDGNIQTVAGNGILGFSGDGGLATEASLSYTNFIAVLPDNSFYVSDSFNYRIRHVDVNGIIQTVAGEGSFYYDGDNQPATNASLGLTTGVAVDQGGALFISDIVQCRIRKVKQGIIETAVGLGYRGDYGEDILATEALINEPNGIRFDWSGKMVFADRASHRVRVVDSAGLIHTLVGTGTEGYAGDGGPASAARLSEPIDVAFDADGNLFISENGNHVIRRVNLSSR